ncbi:hypothetical protein Dip518_000051 [Parelusimicrobium proximum]|uniref:hypothetical protein n=1 Tax=Parelusimicrobium proximum TaxID=3228953 RepID=UPI003D17AF9B
MIKKTVFIITFLSIIIILLMMCKRHDVDLYLLNKMGIYGKSTKVLYRYNFVLFELLDNEGLDVFLAQYFSPENISYIGEILIYEDFSYGVSTSSFENDLILIKYMNAVMEDYDAEKMELKRCFILNPSGENLSKKFNIYKVKANRRYPYLNKKDLTYFIAKGYFTPGDKEFWDFIFSRGLKLRLIDSDFAESNFKKNKTDNLNYEDLKGYIKLTPRDVVKGYPEEFSIEIDCNTISLID